MTHTDDETMAGKAPDYFSEKEVEDFGVALADAVCRNRLWSKAALAALSALPPELVRLMEAAEELKKQLDSSWNAPSARPYNNAKAAALTACLAFARRPK